MSPTTTNTIITTPSNAAGPQVPNKFIKDPYTVGMVAVPFSGGQPKGGVDDGPIELIRFGIIDQITRMGYKVNFNDEIGEYVKLQPKCDPDIGNMEEAPLRQPGLQQGQG